MMKLRKRLTNITNNMAANKKENKLLLWVCFLAYLLLLGYLLFYSTYFGRGGHEDYRYNLTFLQEIGRFYGVGMRSGNWNLFILNVCGNVVVFMPIGAFLPKLFDRCKNLLLTTLLSLEFSLCIELIQLVSRVGSFDVDDLFLNTLGGICGYLLYMICHIIKQGFLKRNSRK